jgi:hypothetical protein
LEGVIVQAIWNDAADLLLLAAFHVLHNGDLSGSLLELGLGFPVLPGVFEEIAFGVGHQSILDTAQLEVAVVDDRLVFAELPHLGLLLPEDEEGAIGVGRGNELDARNAGLAVGCADDSGPVNEVAGGGLATIDVVPGVGIELEERDPFRGGDFDAIGLAVDREADGDREVEEHVVAGT